MIKRYAIRYVCEVVLTWKVVQERMCQEGLSEPEAVMSLIQEQIELHGDHCNDARTEVEVLGRYQVR